jgi:phytoene dehydrogenase-like protein
LAAAICAAQAGFDVEVREVASQAGGAARSGELTLPGFVHDLGSAVHPLGIGSPFFSKLALERHGLHWLHSPAELAHPLDDGTAVILERDVRQTASQLGPDGPAYRKLFEPLANHWWKLAGEILPLRFRFPQHPILLAQFGIQALQPCTGLAKALFHGPRAPALFGGMCAHSSLELQAPISSSFGMVLGAAGHAVGWPVPQAGAQSISSALIELLAQLGGRVRTNSPVKSLRELESFNLVFCDVTPRQFLALAGDRLRPPFRQLLERYTYGPGVFKMDWALREPIPWRANDCRRAITVHLGGPLEEMVASERAANQGCPPERPFVLLAQPSLFDPTRAPVGRHTAWAYCHVPNGWSGSALEQIESQIERFAPGFRECVLARAVHNTAQMQAWNPNLIGGDINGGKMGLRQFALRPTWRRYRTPLKGVYLCSSSTPPGGAVHGMCGYWAAVCALRDFGVRRR